MGTSTLEKNIIPQLGVSELWLVVFHATTSLRSFSVSSAPFRDSTTPFTAQRFPLPPRVPLPVHFVKRIWSRESQNNVQWTLLYHPWSGYEEKGIWPSGGKKGGRADRTCRHFVCWGRKKKGAVHANRVFCGRRARCVHKEPADGSRWPTVTPEEMHPYNNDILPHKAPCVLVATHGHMSERRPSISSHSVALTLSAPIAHLLFCVAFQHRALSLCISCQRFRICLWRRYLKAFHPCAGIFVAHFRETGSGDWVIHVGGRSVTSGCRGSSWKMLTTVQMSVTVGLLKMMNWNHQIVKCIPRLHRSLQWSETFDWTREGHSESQPLMDYDSWNRFKNRPPHKMHWLEYSWARQHQTVFGLFQF